MFLAQTPGSLLEHPEALGIGAIAVVALNILGKVALQKWKEKRDIEAGVSTGCSIPPETAADIRAHVRKADMVEKSVEQTAVTLQNVATTMTLMADCLRELRSGQQEVHGENIKQTALLDAIKRNGGL